MKNLLVRAITGIVFVSLVLGAIFYSDLSATIVFSIFMLLGLIEFYKLFQQHKIISIRWETGVAYGVILYAIALGIIYELVPPIFMFLFVPITFLIMLTELWRKKENPLTNMAIIILGAVYIVLPFFFLIYLNKYNDSLTYYSKINLPTIAGLFILVWTNDTFAYLSGRLFGKTKLFERISPNKTWEGTIGGIAFTLLAGYLIAFFSEDGTIIYWIISAIIIAPSAILGDLLESLFKRSLNIKDSGNILPGHGGILDRFDAALFAIPFFVAWTFFYTYF